MIGEAEVQELDQLNLYNRYDSDPIALQSNLAITRVEGGRILRQKTAL